MAGSARALALVALVVLGALPAAAQTGGARLSAVPGDSKRFVLNVVPQNGWMVRQIAELIELTLPGYTADIALPSAVAPPLTDLSATAEDGATVLRFVVLCDCSLAVALRSGGGLSIDLIERAAAKRPPAPVRAPVPPRRETAGAPAPAEGSEIDVAEARKRMMAQLLRAAEAGLIELDRTRVPSAGLPPDASAGSSGAKETPGPEPRATVPPDRAAVPPEEDADVKRDASKTAAIGKRDDPRPATENMSAMPAPDPRRVARRAETERSPPEPAEPEAAEKRAAAVPGPENGDTEARADADAMRANRPPAICHGAATFNLPRPDTPSTWTAGVGQLRAELIGEFDRPNPDAVVDLGRIYLSAGLAEEAFSVLTEFGAGDAKAAVLAEVATVIAGKALPAGASVMRVDCLGPQALWRALALEQAGDHEGAMAAEQAAGRALEGLPRMLRREVAARLGIAAANAGQWDAARRLHALAGRSDPEDAVTAGWQHFLAARVAQWNGDEVATIRALTLARTADPAVAAEATLMLAETVLRSGRLERDGLPRLITDLGLIARLYRGTAVGGRAAALEVRLADLVSGRQRAIDLLTLGLALGDFSEQTFTATLSAMAESDDAKARDSIAAIYLDDPVAFDPALTDPGFRAVLARSLVRMGLPAQAAGLYAAGSLPEDIAASLAQGYLDIGDHRSAIALIADLPQSPERDRLHRLAMAGTGKVVAPAGVGAADEKPSPESLVALARAAIAAGDLARALDLTLQRLDHDGDASTAETAAMIALALGRTKIPDAAADQLRQSDPDLLARIDALFSTPPARMDPADPASATAYLKRLDAEIAVIEDALNDG